MRIAYGLIFFFTTLLSPLCAEMAIDAPSFIDQTSATSQEPRLMINNRPLAKINGKVISLYDIVKRMDLFLYDYYPEYTPSAPEKYQFYMSRWQATLDDMVADELVLLDAEQKEIKVSDGEVRENLEERFGPNIMSNLDKVNLQYEEAREIIRNELTTQQLIGMKVHAKAFQIITPQVIKAAYDNYLEKNPPEDEWKYQVLSIRGKDKEICEAVAEKAYTLLEDHTRSLESVVEELDEEGVSVSVSDDYSGATPKISKLHFDVIKALTPDTYSPPVSQVSRFDNSNVVRIFHLKDMVKNLPKVFDEMHDKLKNELLFETSDKEKASYIKALKVRFGYDTHDPKFELPEDYRPLSLYKPSELRQFLQEMGIEPKKGLSQNFLIDGNILRKLVSAAQLQNEDTVLEIGPGPGVLTEALLNSGAHVIAIEKDEKLAKHLERLQNGKLEILIDDFRNVRIEHLLKGKEKVKVIANIPYNITGIILQELLPKTHLIESIHLMVQREVAERCVAKKGAKDYSSFSLFTRYHANPKLLFTVAPSCFYPPPKIDSAILELKLKSPPVKAPYEPFFQLIRTAFQQRRKMLRASLKTLFPSNQVEMALESLGLPKTTRPQELDLEEFSALFFALNPAKSEQS